MNINKELESIIITHNIDCNHKRFREKINAVALLNEFKNEIANIDKTLIIASKLTDIKMFCADTNIKDDVQQIIVDIDDKESFRNICIEGIEHIIIVSFDWHKEISVTLWNEGIKGNSIYDYFSLRGLELDHEYYAVFPDSHHSFHGEKSMDYSDYNPYGIIFYDKNKYKTIENEKLQQIYLERLIFNSVYIKDFLSVEKHIEEYINRDFERKDEYKSFLVNLKQLLSTIKIRLDKRRNNIIMFWIDALEYGEDEKMPYLKELSNKGLSFEQAYTVTPYTHFTAKTIFSKKKVIDDASYEMEEITRDNSITIQYLEEKGYRFKYYGFSEQYSKELKASPVINKFTPASSMYWDMIQDLLVEDKLFCMVHELIETHDPHLSANLEGQECVVSEHIGKEDTNRAKLRESQREPSRLYMDKQLEFYSEFLQEQYSRIYMSDHGHTVRGRFHTILKVVGEKIKPQKHTKMFSYIDFYELIQYIVEPNKDINLILRDYVEVQDVDYYHPKAIEKTLNKEQFNKKALIGYRGVITPTEEFIRYNDGEEAYFLRAKNIQVDKNRIAELRILTGTKKVDIENEEKFKYSRLVYKVLENYKKRTANEEEKKNIILNNIFREIPENEKIAIRCGGENTRRLYWAIDWEQRAKISYIIDTNLECVSGMLGIPVILPEQIKEKNIDTIIVSAFPCNESIKKELDSIKDDYRIIDMYNHLEENGVKCEREFYNPVYIDEDFIF